MRTRTVVVTAVLALATIAPLSPADASGTITGSWTASAFPPDPSNGGHCAPRIASARATHPFVVPGPGTLTMALNNKLDWSGDFRDSHDEVLAEADGQTPQQPEVVELKFTKKTAIVMGACNLTGEPSVTVTYSFRPRKIR